MQNDFFFPIAANEGKNTGQYSAFGSYMQFQGNSGRNWHGPSPTYIADHNLEPNFRMFDPDIITHNSNFPEPETAERIFRSPKGQAIWSHSWMDNDAYSPFALPWLVNSLWMACWTQYGLSHYLGRPMIAFKSAFFMTTFMGYVWFNGSRWYLRERGFLRDFMRNQGYALDELKEQREKVRAREALYELKHEYDPVKEYRLKEWQLSQRFAS